MIKECKNCDLLSSEEAVKLFVSGVLDTMERAVCAALFLLRPGEIFALKPEDLDWKTPKITVRRTWKNFGSRGMILSPLKSNNPYYVPFPEFLQTVIKNLWEENGQHEFVFSLKNGTIPGPHWIRMRFNKWLSRAGIVLQKRWVTPYSLRRLYMRIANEVNLL